MLVLTIVAIRLIGIWLLAAYSTGAVTLVLSLASGWSLGGGAEIDRVTAIAIALSASLPLVGGLILILAAVPLANMVVPKRAHDLPIPTAISTKAIVQIGVFLIGLWLVGLNLPVLVSLGVEFGLESQLRFVVGLALGLLLILGSGLFAGLVGKLRSWP
ncbi:MAG: hypothetical protein ABMA14_05930 [Hyphomonadaceae bacterium]